MSQSTALQNVWTEIVPAIGESPMDRLFNRLDGAYPIRWKSAFPNEKSIQNWQDAWSEAFIEERIKPDEVKRGISACRKQYDWPPSLSEFLKACRPPVNPEAAYAEAIKQLHLRKDGRDAWSHPAIYWATQSIGDFDMANQSWSSIKSRWVKTLNEFLEEQTLPAVPAFLVQLPAPGKTSIEPEEAKRRIDEAASSIKPARDPKAWARRIMQNPKAYLHEISHRYAAEVLGVSA